MKGEGEVRVRDMAMVRVKGEGEVRVRDMAMARVRVRVSDRVSVSFSVQ